MWNETMERPLAGHVLETLRAASPERRGELLAARLREELGERLGIPPARIGGADDLRELGMDSLKGIEFKGAVEAELGLALSSTLLFDHPDLESLVGFLLDAAGLSAEEARDAHDS